MKGQGLEPVRDICIHTITKWLCEDRHTEGGDQSDAAAGQGRSKVINKLLTGGETRKGSSHRVTKEPGPSGTFTSDFQLLDLKNNQSPNRAAMEVENKGAPQNHSRQSTKIF